MHANYYSDLIRHYETKHSAKRQEFICPHCDDKKAFSRSDALRYVPPTDRSNLIVDDICE